MSILCEFSSVGYVRQWVVQARSQVRKWGGSENKWDLTSGRWPRWVARYEKGGWAVHFRSDIPKVGGGGGGGVGQFASGPLRNVGGGGGSLVPSLICIYSRVIT